MGWLGGLSDRRWIGLVFLLGTLTSALFALATPPWQAPDEPGHVEYACLMGRLRRPVTGDDLDAGLQREIIASLARHDFWAQVRQTPPETLPASFAADPFLLRSGRQIGDEPPTYYLIPALLCQMGGSIEVRLRLIRLLGAATAGAAAMVVAWGWSGGAAGALRILHPALLALLPMPAFVAASANNDGLAAAAAAVTFAAVLRIQRLGWRWTTGLLALAGAAAAVAVKKTGAFLWLWLAALAVAQVWTSLRRRGWSQGRLVGAAALLSVALALIALLPAPAPAGWRSAGLPLSVTRVRVEDGWAVRVVDRWPLGYARVYQSIAGPDAASLRGQRVAVTAQVRSIDSRPAAGRLTVRDGAGVSQTRFTADDAWQIVTLEHVVAPESSYVKAAVAPGAGDSPAETGGVLVRRVTLETAGQADPTRPWLVNADFSVAARLGAVAAAPLTDTWQQFRPRLAAAGAGWQRYPLYAALLFPGFWGNFGWLQRPLPLWVYAALAVVCTVAGLGVLRVLRDRAAALRGVTAAWSAAVLLALALALTPMLGRDWQPQGRYLFTALTPITGLLLIGLDRWLAFDSRPRRAGLVILATALLCVAGLLRAA